jgi:hypothetical protein
MKTVKAAVVSNGIEGAENTVSSDLVQYTF